MRIVQRVGIYKSPTFQGELSQLQILGGEQQRRQRHTVNRHKHTFPEPHNPSVATPSPPRVKNHSARWCVGKTQRAGEHEKTQSRFCGAQPRFWFDAIMADRWRSLTLEQSASHHGNFPKTLNTKRHKLQDFLLWSLKNGNQSISAANKRAKQPLDRFLGYRKKLFWVYTSLKFYISAWCAAVSVG